MNLNISWGAHVRLDDIGSSNGYGYATERIVSSLRSLGYHVESDDASADVHLHFDQPQHLVKPREDIYTIMYLPWESTKLQPGWAEIMNSCDEVWTPSPLIAEWYQKYAGVNKKVYVYEHGVDSIWTPVERTYDSTFKFLHVGGEASRKGVKEAMQSRRLAFGAKDVEITLKVLSRKWNFTWMPKVNVINEKYDVDELVNLYHTHHAFVYPSYGEGFGLTPLQAMATGMPTLTVGEWAPYAKFLDPDLTIDSKMIKSPWPVLHPGNMLQPDQKSLIAAMQRLESNYDYYVERALDSVPAITSHYDWDRLTDECFTSLEKRLKNL
jgi:glycosyltransferase involved in cell wall biosynthesis